MYCIIMRYKTIRISKENWNKLVQRKAATFDDVISELLNAAVHKNE